MRLIDADELIETAHRIRLDSRERIEQMIESAPTIEPEQKHGRWEVKYISDFRFCVYCSVCGERQTHGEKTNYCPNCGARMEENNG